ncbi:Lrp/AsnC family transcriptional regulator [Pedobacter nutrimenti]|jgi:DNA-binding Lrp family transcriptional regulator|uniref:DNA-binding Lrp family transcriptional regulator n=2 Tax=Pedobacter nutrimenti TaxID=1241337 RepID=A0A318UDD0_9SPHI|nr:DNA-binding Lrp family transcriptional regulator [Pedobacter nutrimenti]
MITQKKQPAVFFSNRNNMQSILDQTDLEILRLLQKDAQLTNKEVAFKINKSIATVHERIRKLKEQGYIQRVVAILDRKKINRSLLAFSHVFLKDHTAETLNAFEQEVSKFGEVMECFQMTGAFDFILRISTSDMDAYHVFLRNKLATLPNISTVQSFFVLSEPKSETAYPL